MGPTIPCHCRPPDATPGTPPRTLRGVSPLPPSAATVYDLLLADLARDGSRPLITYYDDASGERMELSVATFANAVAKTANFLRDGLDVQPGDAIALDLPLHWQLPVWLGAAAAVGAAVHVGPAAAAEALVAVGGPDIEPTGAAETVAVSLRPFGLPEPGTRSPGVLDHSVEVRAYGDEFGADPVLPTALAVRISATVTTDEPINADQSVELTHHDVALRARQLADTWGLAPGGRLLSALPPTTVTGLLACLAVPLAVSGSVVLIRHEDERRRLQRSTAERITAQATT